MRAKRVREIVRPFKKGVPLQPSVGLADKVIRAVELMVSHNCRAIAVVRDRRPIGIVCLEDAFSHLGLQQPERNAFPD